jgi:hypothetical protein
MRLGDSRSKSYRLWYQRSRRRTVIAADRLCARLDKLVERAEKLKTGKTRAGLLAMADKVREKLRKIDH